MYQVRLSMDGSTLSIKFAIENINSNFIYWGLTNTAKKDEEMELQRVREAKQLRDAET